MKNLRILLAVVSLNLVVAAASAEILEIPVGVSWDPDPGTGVADGTFVLPEVVDIQSFTIEIAHTWRDDVAFTITPTEGPDFVLALNTGGGGDLGVNASDGSLGNVAPYTFAPPDDGGNGGTWGPLGGGVSTPSVFPTGPFPAGEWSYLVEDTSGGDGGAVAAISIEFNPVPEPGIGVLAFLGMIGVTMRRRR